MIIFGTSGITSVEKKGIFHCPACGAGAAYQQKGVRRFFTLFFVPLIPLHKVADYVECGRCGGTFKPEVLSWNGAIPPSLPTYRNTTAVPSGNCCRDSPKHAARSTRFDNDSFLPIKWRRKSLNDSWNRRLAHQLFCLSIGPLHHPLFHSGDRRLGQYQKGQWTGGWQRGRDDRNHLLCNWRDRHDRHRSHTKRPAGPIG